MVATVDEAFAFAFNFVRRSAAFGGDRVRSASNYIARTLLSRPAKRRTPNAERRTANGERRTANAPNYNSVHCFQ
jgi:hypothetical protein